MSKRRRSRSDSISEDAENQLIVDQDASLDEVQRSEAGPSRLLYPPQAHTSNKAAEKQALRLSNSSSSLFWNSTNNRSLPSKSYDETTTNSQTIRRRRSNVSFRATRNSLEGQSMARQFEAASIASSKSSVGGWIDWLSGKSHRAAERAQASKRLGKKLKRAEERSRLKKQMASRNPQRSVTSFDMQSDSEVLTNNGDEFVRPEMDVPPPNDPTANALNRVASKVKQSRAPRLHFAPEDLKIRKKDLPEDYEQGELYRGLEEFVQASRERRRRNRRKERRRGSKSGSRASRSSHSKSSVSSGGSSSSSSSDSDSSDDSSSTGSSSSSASGRLTMARLRAFFGDSSSDSSDSSSKSSRSSSSNSSTSSHRNNSDDDISSTSDDARSIASKATFRLFRRRRPTRKSDGEESPPQTPRTPRTPAITFQIKGGAERRRKRRAAQRYKAQEKRLIEEGKIPPKPSRKARKKSKMARLQAGGITEYTLFTPIALTTLEEKQPRPLVGTHAFAQQRVNTVGTKAIKDAPPERVLNTVSFAAIKERLHALRRHRRQIDNAAGDIGMTLYTGQTQHIDEFRHDQDLDQSSVKQSISDNFDFEEGDLALPPPALDLPELSEEVVDDVSSTERRRRRRQTTEWHMSDVPLTPHIQMATNFARGFEISGEITKQQYHPTLETQYEGAINATLRDHNTPQSERPSSNENNKDNSNSNKVSSGLSSTTALDSPPQGKAHAAWWLDINCPTYRDMTELSKMFPLHPLTVEDILQQDTREKVEVFESLNYYFVVVRAIDEKYFKFTPTSPLNESNPTVVISNDEFTPQEKQCKHLGTDEVEMKEIEPEGKNQGQGRVDIIERADQSEGLEGVSVGAINLYLIVFSHGVISFHFEDISKHTDHVRRRLLDLAQPVELTSDWIAHGIFDSIVDAFSPLLNFVQMEVEEIERLTDEPIPCSKREATLARKKKLIGMEKNKKSNTDLPIWIIHKKQQRNVLRFAPFIAVSTVLLPVLPPLIITQQEVVVKEKVEKDSKPPQTVIQRIFGFGRHRAQNLTTFQSNTAQEQKIMLRRITETRKIVTGLSRLLTPKNDSVRGLRKRLVELRSPSLSTTEMSIYMGDVHDHIITMLSHLASDDHRLSDTHLSYLSIIRMTNSLTSHSKDEVLVFLATITITIVATIFLCSMFSLNVKVPMNIHNSSDHHWFGGVVAGAGVIPILSILRTYTWIQQAKAKSAAKRAVR